MDIGAPHHERADAARNRRHLLTVVRELMARDGAANVTMDGLAAEAGLGKGTVFRRFGSRAGIFRALLDDEERELQQRVLTGPPPVGPGAAPVDRLVAYGHTRVDFLFAHREIARAAMDGGQAEPVGNQSSFSRVHIRMLLGLIKPDVTDLDVLALQLTAALDGPLVLMLPKDDGHPEPFAQGWTDLVLRVCGP